MTHFFHAFNKNVLCKVFFLVRWYAVNLDDFWMMTTSTTIITTWFNNDDMLVVYGYKKRKKLNFNVELTENVEFVQSKRNACAWALYITKQIGVRILPAASR